MRIACGRYSLLRVFGEAMKTEEQRNPIPQETILRFIKKFSDFGPQVTDCFLRGNCYWFAEILFLEFGGVVCYDQIQGHFATSVNNDLYDITGVIEDTEDFKPFSMIFSEDHLLYERICRDCIRLGVG